MISEVHTDASTEIPFLNKSRIEKMILSLLTFFERYNQQLSSGIIYNHTDLERVMNTRHKPFIISYNGADTRRFVIRDKAVCRKTLGLNQQATYFLFLGSMVRWRGIELLFEIFNQSSINEGDNYLVIVGAGNDAYSKELGKTAAFNKKILFVDHVEQDIAISYINAADICLVPVKKIMTTPGNALKLYDYIACGKPVITQEGINGYADEVLKYKLGIVTDFNDPARAALDLVLFSKDPDLKKYGDHNRFVAETEVSWKSRMLEWIKFSERLNGH